MWPRTEKILTIGSAVVAVLAVVVSLWAANAGNNRVDQGREDDLRARLRDDITKLGELDSTLRGDAGDRQAASLQLGVHAIEAWELIKELGPQHVSPVDLALTAQALAASGIIADARTAIDLALGRPAPEDVRVILLTSAVSVHHQTGDLRQLREESQELVTIYTARLARQRTEGNAYANLGEVYIARVRYVWGSSEASYRNCDLARAQIDEADRLAGGVDPPVAGIEDFRRSAGQLLKANCPA
ncbi:hypothetical protein [Dactylosporangium sp. NPDC006015]|uniref:hypothetical protein n=1 Tax=unclassified Dactylosporangium TaxID=2621675 RepID=UPI0033B16070